MRMIAAVPVIVLLSGCAAATPLGNQVVEPSSSSAQQTITCATEQVRELGYTVLNSNPMGTLRAERRNDEPWWLNMIGINDTYDVIDVNFAGGQLRVSAFSQVIRGSDRDPAAPSEQALLDANAVADECT